jgi:hypothetical protein
VCAAVALPSIQLGPYTLHERIGEGGNGQVYRATGPSGTVAVKLIGNPNDFDDAAVGRFKREIAALVELEHPSLIELLDHGFDGELGPYLVLPLLAGQTLRRLLDGKAVCPEAALLLILPIAEATAALHAHGFVHRDLKPDNAIATPDGSVTVIDLGLAWGEHMTRHTESGAAVGSIGYMSPEQLDGHQVDAAADIWAIGVMLYEAIAGKRPFARSRPTEEVAATLLGSYAKLTAADRRASDELEALVSQCLSLDATKRPKIDELLAALRAQIDWTRAEPKTERSAGSARSAERGSRAPRGSGPQVGTDNVAEERAAAIADPVGYQQRVAAFRVRRLERTARDAIAAKKPFVALALCDRGLAYAPDHPTLVELISQAESATGGKPAVAKPDASRFKPNYIVAGCLVLVVVIFAVAILSLDKDRWKTKKTQPTTTTTSTPISESDKQLVRGMMGLFDKALDASGRSTVPPVGSAPTTAKGWLELAKTQEPTDALKSIRHALVIEPDWVEAQDALCVALAASKDATALEVCAKSIVRSPSAVALRAARATALIHANRGAEAIADLDAVITADPSPQWRRLRATARSAAGDDAGARKDLADACRLGDTVACK